MKDDLFETGRIMSVIVGISGGSDSVALLRMYHSKGFLIRAAHCNFHLRGEESNHDQKFVENLCKELLIPLDVRHFDIYKYIKQHNVSIEMACRDLRYAWFYELKKIHKADRIAVAHTADDNVETFFINLMRGSGISGLRGMIPDTGDIIRPLLTTTKDEILEYLDSINQGYVTDSTNLDSDFRRNYIRNQVLPIIEKKWPGAKRSVLKSMANLRSDELSINDMEHQFIKPGQDILSYSIIDKFSDPVWIVYRFIKRFGGNSSQACEITESIKRKEFQSGKKWQVEGGEIVAERRYLEFVAKKETSFEIECYKYRAEEEVIKDAFSAPLNELWTSLSRDKITFRLYEEGDRIKPLGMKGSVLISKIMKDRKLSFSEKNKVIVALDNDSGEIIWASGLKRSRLFLIGPQTETVFKYLVAYK